MSRQLRIEYPGAIYHVMSQGNRRERIFRDEADRRLFRAALEGTVSIVRTDTCPVNAVDPLGLYNPIRQVSVLTIDTFGGW